VADGPAGDAGDDARTVAAPLWGLRLPGSIQLALHAVVQGRAWLWLDDPQATLELAPGELALVRGGPDHHITHEPGAACLEPAEFKARHANDEHSDDRRATVFLCGAYRFSGDVGEGLLGALPQVLPLSAAVGDPLHDVIAVLSRELATSQPGQQTVLDRLLDILLVLAIRTSFTTSSSAPRWFQASADPGCARPCKPSTTTPPTRGRSLNWHPSPGCHGRPSPAASSEHSARPRCSI
jgi:Cupin